jgi:hypothetical protein
MKDKIEELEKRVRELEARPQILPVYYSVYPVCRGATETPALQKLDKVSRYPRGWAHGDGDAFSADVVKTARRVLTIAASLGLDGTDVFPRRDGGLVASVYTGLDVHDFTVHADGTLEWLHEHDDVEIESQPVTFAELEAKLIELARPQWHSYDHFQSITCGVALQS